MTEVWFGSEGEYSDYGVRCVFSSRQLAEQWAAQGSGRFIEPENDEGFPVLDTVPTEVPMLSLSFFYAPHDGGRRLPPDGSEQRYERAWTYSTYDPHQPPPVSTHQTAIFDPVQQVNLYVQGTDFQRVEKVYSDRKARIIAEFDLIIEAERRSSEQGNP